MRGSRGSYLVAEAAGLQDWIVGNATELRVIRGGSRLLGDAFAAAIEDLEGELGPASRPSGGWDGSRWQVIATASGRISALLGPDVDAEQAAMIVRSRLARDLPGLTTSVGVAPINDLGATGGAFEDARQDAGEAALRSGTRLPASYHLGTSTCDVSGSETASAEATREGWRLSPTSRRRLAADVGDLGRPDVTIERQMGEIGRSTVSHRYSGYVGVVSADGNAIGERFRDLRSASQVEETSEAISAAIGRAEEAAFDAAVAAHVAAGGELPLRLNPIVRAGDDLRYVLPAHVALAFARALVAGAADLQACAGVLLCHAGLPFSLAHDAAEDLLGQAKRTSRAATPVGGGPFVAFSVESGSQVGATTTLGDLSASPYHADELQALLEVGTGLEVSTSQLRSAAAALRAGGRIAAREWALLVLSLDRGDTERLESLWRALGAENDLVDAPFPVRRDRPGEDGPVATSVAPLGDLLLLRALTPVRSEVPA